jgi:hypothetical protein
MLVPTMVAQKVACRHYPAALIADCQDTEAAPHLIWCIQ